MMVSWNRTVHDGCHGMGHFSNSSIIYFINSTFPFLIFFCYSFHSITFSLRISTFRVFVYLTFVDVVVHLDHLCCVNHVLLQRLVLWIFPLPSAGDKGGAAEAYQRAKEAAKKT